MTHSYYEHDFSPCLVIQSTQTVPLLVPADSSVDMSEAANQIVVDALVEKYRAELLDYIAASRDLRA